MHEQQNVTVSLRWRRTCLVKAMPTSPLLQVLAGRPNNGLVNKWIFIVLERGVTAGLGEARSVADFDPQIVLRNGSSLRQKGAKLVVSGPPPPGIRSKH